VAQLSECSQTADRRGVAKLLIDEGWASLPFLNPGVTGLKFTQSLHDVARSLQMNFLKINMAIRYRMPGLRIQVNSLILPILTLKLVAKATSLEPSEKGGGSDR